MRDNLQNSYGNLFHLMMSNLGLLQQNNAINPEKKPEIETDERTQILKWMVRLHERCKISDLAWFKAVYLFDKVY